MHKEVLQKKTPSVEECCNETEQQKEVTSAVETPLVEKFVREENAQGMKCDYCQN